MTKKRRMAGRSRHPSPLVAQRHASLRRRRQERKAEHPFGGDRRLWASLRVVEQQAVNQQRVLRLMRAQPLLVTPHRTLRAPRTPTGSQPRPPTPHEWWGIDMTKRLVAGCGWGSSVVVLDWEAQQARRRRRWHPLHGQAWAGRPGHGGPSPMP